MAYCSKCGKELNQNDAFCASCGNKVEVINNPQPEQKPNKKDRVLTPEENKKANIMSMGAISSLVIPIIICILIDKLVPDANTNIPVILSMSFVGLIGIILGITLIVKTRVNYNKNVLSRIIMWIMIVGLVAFFIWGISLMTSCCGDLIEEWRAWWNCRGHNF